MAERKRKAAAVDQRQDALLQDGAHQGRRCKDARNTPDGDVIAAAITLSMLIQLRNQAEVKPLRYADIQLVIDGFYAAAGVVESRSPMGQLVYKRGK